MTFKPYNFQVTDLEKLRKNNYTGLLAVDVGGGKSISSLLAVEDSGANQTLIIAPQSTHMSAWNADAQLSIGEEVKVIGNSNKKQRTALADFEWNKPGIYVVTPQLFTRADISMWTPDMLIVDEIHTLGRPGSKGQRKLSGYGSRDNPISLQSGMKLALSGTPARNNFERMWSVTRLLWPELNRRGEVAYDNYYGWLHERMEKEKIVIGRDHNGALKYATNWLAEKEPGKLFSEMPCVIQHFRRQTCCDDPEHEGGFLKHDEPNIIKKVVPIAPAQKKAIKELEKQGLAWVEENPLVVDLPITLQQRIRQLCLGVPIITPTGEFNDDGVEKINVDFAWDTQSSFADEVEDLLEKWGDEPVVVYMSSQKFAAALTERLNRAGVSAFEFSGATTKTRTENLAEFGKKYRVMVATLESVGTGTAGIQKVCNNEIWLERSLDMTVNQQAEGRTDRLHSKGQTQRVIIEDDLGYASGRFSAELERRLALAKSIDRGTYGR